MQVRPTKLSDKCTGHSGRACMGIGSARDGRRAGGPCTHELRSRPRKAAQLDGGRGAQIVLARPVDGRAAFRRADDDRSAKHGHAADVSGVGCARCGAMFERLDLLRERVAALLPMPPAVEGHAHIAERVIHAGSDLAVARPVQERSAGLREHVAHAMSHAREHATAAYYRTVDPTPLVGVRPGAVATVVAGCLAIGGGATYCVQQAPTRSPPSPA